MAPAVTRELSVIYGGFTVGGATDRLLDDYHRKVKNYVDVVIEFSFLTTAASEAAFATEVRAIEAAFRKPLQKLEIKQGSATLDTYDPGTTVNTGFNAQPEIIKRNDIGDTGRSRRYEVRITVQLPADLSGQSGRRDSSVEISYSPSRVRTLTITGTYTALTTNAALTQYEASIAAYATSVTTALTGTWELAEEPRVTHDDQNKTVDFEIVYEELIFKQSQSSLDDSAIVKQGMLIRRRFTSPGDTPSGFRGFPSGGGGGGGGGIVVGPGGPIGRAKASGGRVRRFFILSCQYEAWIDKDVISGTTELRTKWLDEIRPWILGNIKEIFGPTAGALVSEEPEFDLPQNRIRANLEWWGVESGAGILEFQYTYRLQAELGKFIAPVWSGDSAAAHVFQGPARAIKSTTERFRLKKGTLSTSMLGENFGDFFETALKENGGNWELISKQTDETPLNLGLDSIGEGINVVDVVRVRTWRFVREPK